MSKPVIYQNACGGHIPLLQVSEEHHRQLFYDCEYIVSYGYIQGSREPQWNKVWLLKTELPKLQDGQIVVWMDADVLALDWIDFNNLLPEGFDIGMVLNKENQWNVGVMVIRVSNKTRKLFFNAWESGPISPTNQKEDQPRINIEMKHLVKCYELPSNYNYYSNALRKPDIDKPIYIKAYHGSHPCLVIPEIQKELEKYETRLRD